MDEALVLHHYKSFKGFISKTESMFQMHLSASFISPGIHIPATTADVLHRSLCCN